MYVVEGPVVFKIDFFKLYVAPKSHIYANQPEIQKCLNNLVIPSYSIGTT